MLKDYKKSGQFGKDVLQIGAEFEEIQRNKEKVRSPFEIDYNDGGDMLVNCPESEVK